LRLSNRVFLLRIFFLLLLPVALHDDGPFSVFFLRSSTIPCETNNKRTRKVFNVMEGEAKRNKDRSRNGAWPTWSVPGKAWSLPLIGCCILLERSRAMRSAVDGLRLPGRAFPVVPLEWGYPHLRLPGSQSRWFCDTFAPSFPTCLPFLVVAVLRSFLRMSFGCARTLLANGGPLPSLSITRRC
jgi:hypothetical protein